MLVGGTGRRIRNPGLRNYRSESEIEFFRRSAGIPAARATEKVGEGGRRAKNTLIGYRFYEANKNYDALQRDRELPVKILKAFLAFMMT